MKKLDDAITELEMSYTYSCVEDGQTLVPQQTVLDTIALLKEQVPKILQYNDVSELAPGSLIWLEEIDKARIVPAIIRVIHVWGVIEFAADVDFLLELPYYNKSWRCWTSRPDEKRRAETPWN